MIEDLKILEQRIELSIQVSNPALHARKRMQEAISFNLKRVFGSYLEVDCIVKGMPSESKEKRRKILPDVKYIVAIASGKGGVGKSTITSNLAGGLQKKGFKVGIVDADIYGPSLPTMFDVVGDRPKMIDIDGISMIEPILAQGVKLLSIGFLQIRITLLFGVAQWLQKHLLKCLQMLIGEN